MGDSKAIEHVVCYISLFCLSLMQSIFSLSLPNENDLYNPIPKITLQELESLLNNSYFDTDFSVDHLKDDGGNLGIIEISGLGSDYKNAKKTSKYCSNLYRQHKKQKATKN